MLKQKTPKQLQYELVFMENLVPENHLLRKIDKYIDFSFIREKTKHLYCENNGRPAIDPEVLFKMLFIGYLYGIRSERQLIQEIEVNIAYRWFLGLSLTDKIPDASTISQNRRRRFKDSGIDQEIFDRIVFMAIKKGMVDGKILYTDSTHLKANANKHKYNLKEVHKSTQKYLGELEKAINDDREAHGKKPLKDKDDDDNQAPPIKETKVSSTDPESGYMVRDGKPKGFFYLDHRTVDSKFNIITDVHVTPGNVNDVDPYIERLDRQIAKFDFDVKYVGLDAGYLTNIICMNLSEREIQAAIAYRLGRHEKGKYTKTKFTYDKDLDSYICPNGKLLKYRTTTRNGYKEYVSYKGECFKCAKRQRCLLGNNERRIIRRHVWEDYKDWAIAFTKTERGKKIYKRRKETVERSFADAKQLHGLRYCRMRGLAKVREQCLLTAAVQNMKKIAMAMAKSFFTRLILRYALN